MESSKFIINTRGPRNTSSNCFLNCVFMAMFGYTGSPFYNIRKFSNKGSEIIYKCFRKILEEVVMDKHPDLSVMRNALPVDMRFGQQDCLETFDNFMKILNFEPMKVVIVRESKNSKGKIYKGKNLIQNISYINLDNDGEDNVDLIKRLFYPDKWEDLGPNSDNWVQDSRDVPSFRWTRQRYVELMGNCLIFFINRAKYTHKRHSNSINTPVYIECGDITYFRFAMILHLSGGTDFGHYVVVIFDGNRYYLYDDSNENRISKNVFEYNSKNKKIIDKNAVMYFYYKI